MINAFSLRIEAKTARLARSALYGPTWINQIFGRTISLGLTENDPASRLSDIAAQALRPSSIHIC